MLQSVELPYFYFSNSVDHIILSLFGILVSAYALYVENEKHKNPKYKALCDFNEHMSCTRVLTSKYGTGFGLVELMLGKDSTLNVPNCVVGIGFYTLQILLIMCDFSWAPAAMFYTCIVSALGSVYLAYILFIILRDVCVVCISMYFVNAGLLYLSYHKFLNLI